MIMYASPRQLGFIRRLANERVIPDDDHKRLLAKLDGPAPDKALDGKAVIAWLLRQPERPEAAARREPAELGVYVRDDRIFVVREFHPQDKPKGVMVRYAKEIVPLSKASFDRLNMAGKEVRWEEQPARGMQWKLRPEEAMPEADYKAFCQLYRRCLACNRRLERADSIDRGKGKVCWDRQQARIAARAALVAA